ncbi:MAG: hypothetical protein AAB368_04885, partial [bacterium]
FALTTRAGLPSAPEWVIVSNADIAFPDAAFFDELIRSHAVAPSAVIAPAILSDRTGADQNPGMAERPSGRRMRFLRAAFSTYPTCLAYHLASYVKVRLLAAWNPLRASLRGLRARASAPSAPYAIYAPHGAFMIFHRSYFDRGGTFDHGAFLFGEEIFIAETCRRLGLAVVHDPRLRVRHRDHVSTGMFPSRKVARFEREANAYLVGEFFSPSAA